MPGSWLYDLLYRVGAPWEGGPRSELIELVESGRLSAEVLTPGRAIDFGCGSGANAIFLARHGFDVVGVDFSSVALAKARRAAERSGTASVRFVRGDLTATSIPTVAGPFDLLVDYGTLDDLSADGRRRMAALIADLARPGSKLVLWCFYGARAELPRMSFSGPSRVAPGIEPGEAEALFGGSFEIERLPRPAPPEPYACFLMTRR